MKIWKKIFLYSIILFIFLFNGAGIFIIENIYNRNLEMAIKSTINESSSVRSSIYLNSDLIESYNRYSRERFLVVFKSYILYSGATSIKNIELFDGEGKNIINTSEFFIDGVRSEVEEATVDNRKFIIRKVGEENLLFVSSALKIGDKTHKLVLTKDISFLSKDKIDNYKLFFLLSVIITILLAIGMYIISKNITNPIKGLIKVSDSIKKGEYSKRAEYTGSGDEIDTLSENFNDMMKVIDDKIHELEWANESKQRFIDNLTHEMKTPITSIIGYSDLLLKGNINDEIKIKAIDYINSQGKRLENLSSTLIKLIMIKKEDVSKGRVSIKERVLDTVKGLRYKIDEKQIEIEVEIECGIILGDKQLIGVLYLNILENAVKASKEGGKIYIRGVVEGNKYKLIIEDEGDGISKDDLEKVKEPFFMVDKSRTDSRNNLGLGLAICNEICLTNNIIFNIESELNKGTVVTLIFELERN